MKRLGTILLLLVLACSQEPQLPQQAWQDKPVTEPGEKLYTVRGTILSRRASDNTVHMDHDEIAGFMPAMRMDYYVRGTGVAALPADGKRVEGKLHVTDRAYWITDVKPIP
jgi:protein SCO1/2